jgi:hypothetical protein
MRRPFCCCRCSLARPGCPSRQCGAINSNCPSSFAAKQYLDWHTNSGWVWTRAVLSSIEGPASDSPMGQWMDPRGCSTQVLEQRMLLCDDEYCSSYEQEQNWHLPMWFWNFWHYVYRHIRPLLCNERPWTLPRPVDGAAALSSQLPGRIVQSRDKSMMMAAFTRLRVTALGLR